MAFCIGLGYSVQHGYQLPEVQQDEVELIPMELLTWNVYSKPTRWYQGLGKKMMMVQDKLGV